VSCCTEPFADSVSGSTTICSMRKSPRSQTVWMKPWSNSCFVMNEHSTGVTGFMRGALHKCTKRRLHCIRFHLYTNDSLSSDLQPCMGLSLLRQMSPATSIPGHPPANFTTRFPCVFLYPVNPVDFGRPHPHWPLGFVHHSFLGNSFSSIRTTWRAHLSLQDFITLTVFGSL
jgi:hypothetical protein